MFFYSGQLLAERMRDKCLKMRDTVHTKLLDDVSPDSFKLKNRSVVFGRPNVLFGL